MKKLLLGSTALIAAVGLSSGAIAADKVKLSLGGYYTGYVAFVDGDAATDRDIAFGSDSEVHVKGKTTLDNGIEVGFRAEFELEDDGDAANQDTTDDLVDEVYIDFKGGFGMIQFGQNDGVSSEMRVDTPMVFQRAAADDIEDIEILSGETTRIETELGDNDATKIKYITPRIWNFQAGISYAPEASNGKSPQGLNTRIDNDGDEQLDAAINWEYEANDVSLAAAFAYYSEKRIQTIATEDDADHFNVGAEIGFGGFTFGGNYTWGDNLNLQGNYDDNEEAKIWSIGATYGNGPWLFGAQYASAKEERMDISSEDEFSSIMGGVTYQVGPSIQIGLGVQHSEDDPTGAASDRDATGFFLETGMKF